MATRRAWLSLGAAICVIAASCSNNTPSLSGGGGTTGNPGAGGHGGNAAVDAGAGGNALADAGTDSGSQVSRTLRRFDGTSAPTVPIAGIAPTQNLYMLTLFARGASDVWASGGDVAHFDGQSWSLVSDAPAAARNASNDGNTYVTGDATSVWLSTPGPRFFRKAD
jgi:hypothetical protein